MTHFSLITCLLSLALFATFVTLGVLRFGWLTSFSSYASRWTKAVPINHMHLWSIVTVLTALLLVPSMLERGEGNLLQCLGFFAPLYLVVVGFTPEWESESDHKQYVIHLIGTSLCFIVTLAWIIFVRKLWWVLLIAVAVFAVAAYFTKTWKKDWFFWLEMAMFASAYAAILI